MKYGRTLIASHPPKECALPTVGRARASASERVGVRGAWGVIRSGHCGENVGMARLLIVHHTVSPATRAMHEAVLDGTRAEGITGVQVQARPALAASVTETLEADGVILGTPANIGYMSGALKHYFDTIYYPLLDAAPRLPFGLWVHGNEDTTGALRAITAIAGALGWQQVTEPVVVTGTPTAADREACWNLGATVAATLGK